MFFCLIAFPVAHFKLQEYAHIDLYLSLMTFSLFGVIMVKHYYKDRHLPFDFDENLTAEAWLWIGGAVVGILGLSAFFSSVTLPTGQFDATTVIVPTFGWAYQFPTFVNDMLFNLTLIAPAEELAKLVSTCAIYLMLKQYRFIEEKIRLAISVIVPCFFWSVLHVYGNPQYIGHPAYVISAFVSGIILYVVLWKTKSLLAMIMAHGFYNCLVIYMWEVGMIVGS